MRYIITLLFCCAFLWQAHAQTSIVPLHFITTLGTTRLDSLTAALEINDTDTSAWIAIDDSLVRASTAAIVLYSDEDTLSASVEAQWSSYNAASASAVLFQSASTLDSLVSGTHSGATRNPLSASLYFRKPPGANRVRFLIHNGTGSGQFPAGGTAKRIPVLRGHFVTSAN
jgi:hypothetical protein